jgi:putative membrane protein
MRFTSYLAAGAVLLLPAAAFAQAMPAKTFVAKAGASDMYEIQSSQLVLATTQDPKVREFANSMIADHTKSTADIKAAAAQDKVKAGKPKLEPMQAANIRKLRAAKGTARDQEYWNQQKTSHQMALELHQTYSQGGDAPALKATAAQVVPVVQHHIDMLNNGGSMTGM